MQKQQMIASDNKILIYTDGGSRGNPGPAACGYIVNDAPYGKYLGKVTNNEAEYAGVIEALKKVKAMFSSGKERELELEVRMDSELLVKQFKREYRVKAEHLKPLYAEVERLIGSFRKVIFIHIPREKNKEADKMVNKILDEHM